jgi:hypothetical protein
MQWIAPSEKDIATDTLEKRLWAAADQLRAYYSHRWQTRLNLAPADPRVVHPAEAERPN